MMVGEMVYFDEDSQCYVNADGDVVGVPSGKGDINPAYPRKRDARKVKPKAGQRVLAYDLSLDGWYQAKFVNNRDWVVDIDLPDYPQEIYLNAVAWWMPRPAGG